jgi:hypothetical protein
MTMATTDIDILSQLDPSEEQALSELMNRLPQSDSNSTGSNWNGANVDLDLENDGLLSNAGAEFDPFFALNAPAADLIGGGFDSNMGYDALGMDWDALFAGGADSDPSGGVHDSMIGMKDSGLINNMSG